MIVKKPIGAVKVGNSISRLTIGNEVPAVVLEYWKNTGQLEELKKGGFISEVVSVILEKPVYVESEIVKSEVKTDFKKDYNK